MIFATWAVVVVLFFVLGFELWRLRKAAEKIAAALWEIEMNTRRNN